MDVGHASRLTIACTVEVCPSVIIAMLSASSPATFAPVVQFCIVALLRVPRTLMAAMSAITPTEINRAAMPPTGRKAEK